MRAGSFVRLSENEQTSLTALTYPAAWKLLDLYRLAETAVIFNSHTCFLHIQSHIHCANSFVTSSFSHWHFCYPATTPFLGKTLLGRGLFNSPSDSDMRLVGDGREQEEGARREGAHFLQALCLLFLLVSALGSCNLISFSSPLFPFIFFRGYLSNSKGTCLMGGKKCSPPQIHCPLLPAKTGKPGGS